MSTVTQFATGPSGSRMCSVTVGALTVTVCGSNSDHNDAAYRLAEDIAAAARRTGVDEDTLAAAFQEHVTAGRLRRLLIDKDDELVQIRTALHAEITRLRAILPPKQQRRVMAPGCVRFDDRGQLWLLSRRETGWSAFGVVLSGWDELFRHYAVIVTAHGTDEHGPWWTVDNSSERT